MDRIFLAEAATAVRHCPVCRSTYVDRVRRRLIDRAVGLVIRIKRYRCESCGWQGNFKVERD